MSFHRVECWRPEYAWICDISFCSCKYLLTYGIKLHIVFEMFCSQRTNLGLANKFHLSNKEFKKWNVYTVSHLTFKVVVINVYFFNNVSLYFSPDAHVRDWPNVLGTINRRPGARMAHIIGKRKWQSLNSWNFGKSG